MLKVAAVLYDRIMQGVEAAGLTEWRRDLLTPLSGTVLEVGAGTGRNLALYPPAVTSLVLAEPDRHMRARLVRTAAATDRHVDVIGAPAEDLPFPDATFDAVVSTLVLCSVRDQATTLDEIRRVLRPEGRFVFIEHVAATGRPRRLRWQRRVEPIWRRLAGNCHLTRTTEEVIGAAGFDFVAVEHASMRKAPPIVRPTIRGYAALRRAGSVPPSGVAPRGRPPSDTGTVS